MRASRAAKKIAGLHVDALQPVRPAPARLKRAGERGVAFHRQHLRPLGYWQRERPAPGEEIGDARRARNPVQHQPDQRRLALCGGLQESPGRRLDQRSPKPDHGRAA